MENNVLLATFENQLSAFEALADIKTKYSGENYVITQAAVVRKEDDKLSFKDGFEVNANGNIGFLKHLVNNHYALILLTSESGNTELDNFWNKYNPETILRKDAKVVQKDLEFAKEYESKLKTDIEYKELKEKFESKSKEVKENLADFSEKIKANAEAFTEDLTKFVLDLKNKFKN